MRNKTNRVISLLLVLAMVLGLCACGGKTGGGKDSSKLDLDYEGADTAQDQQEEKSSGFQSWVSEVFSFGKKDTDSSASTGQEGSSGSGQTQQGGSSGQSGSGPFTGIWALRRGASTTTLSPRR